MRASIFWPYLFLEKKGVGNAHGDQRVGRFDFRGN